MAVITRLGLFLLLAIFGGWCEGAATTTPPTTPAPTTCDDARRAVAARGFKDVVATETGTLNQHILNSFTTGTICEKSCCSEFLENKMYIQAAESLDVYLKDSIGKLVSLLDTRAKRFDEFFRQMMNQSRLDFHNMFHKTYGKSYLENSEVFADFFKELETYYGKGTVLLSETMETFFNVLYQRMFVMLNQQYQFDSQYIDCVVENMAEMKPFGDVPYNLGKQLQRSFVATRTLYKSLAKAASVANAMGSVRVSNACVRRTVRMQLCNACVGVPQLACSGFCTETVAGCFAVHAELSQTWDSFVDAIEKIAYRLAGAYDIEAVVEPLNIKISEAVMIFQENRAKISEKIFQKCGKPPLQKRPKRKVPYRNAGESPDVEIKLDSVNGAAAPSKEANGKKKKKTQAKDDVPELKKMLADIKLKVKDTKQFWAQLPYQYCNDLHISASPGESDQCWNGTTIGAYKSSDPKPDADSKSSPVLNEQLFVLRGYTDKLRKAFHGEDASIVDDTEEVAAGSGSGSGDGSHDDLEDDDEDEERQMKNVEPDISPTSTTAAPPPPVVHSTSNANRSSVSLPRALVQYLLPIVMAWFGGAIRDLL